MPKKQLIPNYARIKVPNTSPAFKYTKRKEKLSCVRLYSVYLIPHREQTPSVHTVYENDQVLLCKSYEINTLGEQNSETLNAA
jgi:hypothetical protein